MKRRILDYAGLVREEERLTEMLRMKKENIRRETALLQQELEPFYDVLGLFGKLTTKERAGYLLDKGVGSVVDFLVKKVILGRASWLVKQAGAWLAKNYSSHFVAAHKDEWAERILLWFTDRSNGKMAPPPSESMI